MKIKAMTFALLTALGTTAQANDGCDASWGPWCDAASFVNLVTEDAPTAAGLPIEIDVPDVVAEINAQDDDAFGGQIQLPEEAEFDIRAYYLALLLSAKEEGPEAVREVLAEIRVLLSSLAQEQKQALLTEAQDVAEAKQAEIEALKTAAKEYVILQAQEKQAVIFATAEAKLEDFLLLYGDQISAAQEEAAYFLTAYNAVYNAEATYGSGEIYNTYYESVDGQLSQQTAIQFYTKTLTNYQKIIEQQDNINNVR